MITKHDAKLYAELYDKATKALNTYGSEKFKNATIQNIDQYFACLLELARIEEVEKMDPIFTILPAQEGRFVIDANTRTITPPSDVNKRPQFGANTNVAVQGDEISEILYFEIDRYFDAMDLANMDIIIQWRPAGSDTSSLSAIYKKSVTLAPGKIVFGWPITNEITSHVGKIEYSIRFYRRGQDANGADTLIYSFSTLTHTINIQEALNFKLTDEVLLGRIVNKNDRIYSNLRNSTIAGSYDIAIPALEGYYIITADKDPVKLDDEANKEYDLYNENNERLSFVVKATIPKDVDGNIQMISGSGISYTWYRKDSESAKNEDATALTDNVTSLYLPVLDVDRNEKNYNPNEFYYYYNAQEKLYVPYIKSNDPYPFDDRDDNGVLIPLYQKYSKYTPSIAGYYYTTISNILAPGKEEYITSAGWNVPYAEEPVYSYPNSKLILLDDETIEATLIINAEVAKGELVNKWYINEISDNFENATEYTKDGASITTNECSVNKEGWYFLKAENNHNNTKSSNHSDAIQVSYDVTKPSIEEHLYNGNPVINQSTIIVAPNKPIGISAVNGGRGDLQYQWYKVTDNDSEIEIAEAKNNSMWVPATAEYGDKYRCKVTNVYNGLTKFTDSYTFIVME